MSSKNHTKHSRNIRRQDGPGGSHIEVVVASEALSTPALVSKSKWGPQRNALRKRQAKRDYQEAVANLKRLGIIKET